MYYLALEFFSFINIVISFDVHIELNLYFFMRAECYLFSFCYKLRN